jgi:hypothetical protein
MLGERKARGKSIYSMKKTLNLHEMVSRSPRGVAPLGREGQMFPSKCIPLYS